jgi:glycosyltransferase involved in cell wall biosynthesis
MKVLLLRDSFPNGGAERQLCLLAANLPSGVQTRLWGMGGGPFLSVLRENGLQVDVDERRFRLDPAPALCLWRLMWRWRPDVVCGWGSTALLAAPVCLALRVPLIDASIRNAFVRPRQERARRLAFRVARLVVANSHAGLVAWGVPTRKGRVVQNGVDPRRLARAGEIARRRRTAHGGDGAHGAASTDPFTVVMTGRMTAAKDFATFIAAARAAGDGWRFLAVGDGPDQARLRRDAGELVSAGRLVFADAGLEVLDVIGDADAGVLLTDPAVHAEGCSNSLLEYMACGLPVVCSDGGGNREVVVDGETGYVVPPADPQALLERLRELRADPALRLRMGQAGRRRVEERFSMTRFVDGWTRVLKQALGTL